MCGIAGFIGKGSREDGERMIKVLNHRGPDSRGIFYQNEVCLAHARLSIIDLTSTGDQPMRSKDGSVTVVFNGEIYNFKKHRERLQKEGYKFSGTSDTEVILALYDELKEECFSELDGMFAIALYDSRVDKLYLARDRMGKKPLYWGVFSGTIIFGSELKAVLAHPAACKEFSPEALSLYLTHEYIPTPYTPFKNIYKLSAGTYLTYSNQNIATHSFWNTEFLKRPVSDVSLSQHISQLDKLLYEAVSERMVADVPLGVFLSGGLDSSTVSYYASKLLAENGGGPLKTFSIGFKEASFDESKYAEQVAKHIGSEHYSKIFTATDVLELLPELAAKMDEPFADASLLPTSLLSRFAREHVTVALGGDGGDELLLGYDTFFASELSGYYNKLPSILNYLIQGSSKLLPTSHKYMSFDFKVKRFLRGAGLPTVEQNQAWMGAFSPTETRALLSPELERQVSQFDTLSVDKQYWSEVEGDDLRHLSWLYARTYMMDGVLVKVDRASMFASLEVRAPFLATKLVEFAYSLPSSEKLHGSNVKYILKKLMEDKLPKDIVNRRKKGFGAPIGEWLRGPLLPLLKEKLSRERIGKQGLFTPSYVDKMVWEHEFGHKDNRKELWTLLMFQLWYDGWNT